MSGLMCAFVGSKTTVAATPAAFTDDSNTKLLLHMNGSNGSTTFSDDNSSGRTAVTVTRNSNAQISTAQSKFGGASGLFDGSLDYLKMNPASASDLAIGSGDFTIECYIRFAKTSSGMIIDTRGSPQNGSGWCWYVNSNSIRWYFNFSDRITSGTLTTNTWYHVAMVRNGDDHKMYLDGVQTGSTYTASNTYVIGTTGSTFGVWIGENQPFSGGVGAFEGYMDEFRISNIARYTGSFTPGT